MTIVGVAYALRLDGSRVGVIAMFPDVKKKSAQTEAVYSEMVKAGKITH